MSVRSRLFGLRLERGSTVEFVTCSAFFLISHDLFGFGDLGELEGVGVIGDGGERGHC